VRSVPRGARYLFVDPDRPGPARPRPDRV